MVDLPKNPRRIVTTQAPQGPSPADAAAPFAILSRALGELGDTLEEAALPQAEAAGAKSVTRNADGSIQAQTRYEFTRTDKAYNRGVQMGAAAEYSGQLRSTMGELARKFENDPQAFKAAADQTVGEVAGRAPGALAASVKARGTELASQHYEGLVDAKQRTDLRLASERIQAEGSRLDDEMAALARQGGVDTPEYKAKQSELNVLLDEQLKNPKFAMPPEKANLIRSQAASRHKAEALIGTVERELETNGLAAAARKTEDLSKLLDDPKLALSPQERQQYQNGMKSVIAQRSAVQTALKKEAAEEAKDVEQRIMSRVEVDPREVSSTVEKLQAVGDVWRAAKLQRMAVWTPFMDQFKRAPLREAVGMLKPAGVGIAASGIPQEGRALLNAIASTESPGYNVINGGATFSDYSRHPKEGQRGSSGIAAGRYQFLPSTWERVSKMTGIKDFSPANQDRAAWWLAQSDYRANTGRDLLTDLRDPAKVAEVRRALGTTWLGLTTLSDAKLAAKLGQPVPEGASPAEAAAQPGGSSGSAPPGMPLDTWRQVQAVTLSKAKESWTSIQPGLERGIAPSREELGLIAKAVEISGDEEFAQQVADKLTTFDKGRLLSALPREEAETFTANLRAAAAGGTDANGRDYIITAEKIVADRRKVAAESPLQDAENAGIVQHTPALTFRDPQALAEQLQLRKAAVRMVDAAWGTGQIHVFKEGEAAGLGQIMQTGKTDEQVAILGTMAASLPPEVYRASMAEVFKKGDDKVAAIAGAKWIDDPEVARSILRGRALLASEPHYRPKAEDLHEVLLGDRTAGDSAAAFPVSVLPQEMRGQWSHIVAAATAIYADRLNRRGVLPAELDEETMIGAVNAVTGGVVEYNGAKVIAPKAGLSQEGFDELTASIDDQDFVGAMVSSGRPVTAAEFRSSAKLQSYDDGRYLVYFGDVEAPQYVVRDQGVSGPGRRQPVVLDLRGR
jgi:muramidase (phage lysozyme)